MKYHFLISIAILLSSHLQGQGYQPPKIIGGENTLKDVIKYQMIYPDEDLKKGIKGTVVLEVYIDKNGKPYDTEIKKSVSPQIDKEASRIAAKLLWYAASKRNTKVSAVSRLEITFHPRKYKRYLKDRGYTYHHYKFPPDTSLRIYLPEANARLPHPLYPPPSLSMRHFIINTIRYPEAAVKNNISGDVKLSFIVEPEGYASHIEIIQALGAGCTDEAIRLLKLLKWRPAVINNHSVRMKMEIQFGFSLDHDESVDYVPVYLNNSLQ